MTPINQGVAASAVGVDARRYHHGHGPDARAVLAYGVQTALSVGIPLAFRDDCAQEVSIAWAARRDGETLPGVARRAAIDYARRVRPGSRHGRAIETVPLAGAVDERAPDMIEPAEDRIDALARLTAMVRAARLTDDQCRVLILVYAERRTLRDAGAVLGMSPSAVMRRRDAALGRLRAASTCRGCRRAIAPGNGATVHVGPFVAACRTCQTKARYQ